MAVMQAFSSLPATIAIQNHFGGGDANSLMASAFKTNAQLIAVNNNNNNNNDVIDEEVSVAKAIYCAFDDPLNPGNVPSRLRLLPVESGANR